jgi:hypothetical protein
MTAKPAIPFMPNKELGPLHLRPWTPSELEQARRMLRAQEQLRHGPAAREQGRK